MRQRHAVAVCRWCGGRFERWWNAHWLCATLACAERQRLHAIPKEPAPEDPDVSPYVYVPTPAGVELHEDRHPNVLFGGAAGGSKSFGLRWDAYKWCRQIDHYAVLLLRRTFPELDRTHLRDMMREAGVIGGAYRPSERRMLFPNGSFVEAGHCESTKDMLKYLSTEYDHIIFDEGSTFDEEPIREISSRARSAKPLVLERGGAFVRFGSNPGGPGALYLLEHFISQHPDPVEFPRYRPEFYSFIRARIDDNPYLSEDYESTRLDPLSDTRRKQLRDGDWSVFGSQFFHAWSPTRDGLPWHVANLDAAC